MPKLIQFRRRPIRDAALYALTLTANLERSNGRTEIGPLDPPERLGNLLQRLTQKRPAAVHVIESIVADMLKELE